VKRVDVAPEPKPVTVTTGPKTGQRSPKTGRSTSPQPRVAPPPVEPPPPVVLRKVSINATPWAYFTIDGGATRHETMKTVQLAPGKHRIHFSNPVLKIERDVTIDVPADRDTSHVERLAPP
jgi:hypothetical protein